ncbi:hypothetical protein D9758_004960 [Tetrapyrgos nigripes]|uniref:UDP-Glycosyltransferase/glycogen phosphorylase n=1 Tax=Tetrapyrgos nigripes TaxID=182062 RepID=A0A8H5GW14_9AGAR|nr:hypothetical protein D9758_004960 [Tetrapyrgos nigripes]
MNAFAHKPTGRVISIPGIPTVYDHENVPQVAPISGSLVEEIASCYEKAAIEHVRENWLEKPLGCVLYPIGPLSTSDSSVRAGDDPLKVGPGEEQSPKALAIEFLDMMREKCGEKSVIYMSFGSIFWPSDEDKLWAVIEEILASGTPLILAHPSPFMKPIAEDKLRFIKEHPLATEFEWAPQETILSHPATGWFISHGGWNSTQEVFAYRVPQIFWLFGGDQPYNSLVISDNHKAGFELINVRTGENGTKPVYRFKDLPDSQQPTFTVDAVRDEVRGLLAKLKGAEGQEKRKNFQKLGAAFLEGWSKDGEARASMEKFLKKYID